MKFITATRQEAYREIYASTQSTVKIIVVAAEAAEMRERTQWPAPELESRRRGLDRGGSGRGERAREFWRRGWGETPNE